MSESLTGFLQPLPNVEIYTFWAWIPQHELTKNGPQAKGTTVANHIPRIDNYASDFSAYKLSHYDNEVQTFKDGVTRQRAWFAPNRSSSKDTAVWTDYFYEKGMVHWPPVISSIKLVGGTFSGSGSGDSDTSCELFSAAATGGGGGTTGAFIVPADMPGVQVVYSKDPYRGVTKFKVEYFLSDVQFDQSSASTPLDQYARTAHFDRHVVSLALPESLHAQFIVPILNVQLTDLGVDRNFPSTTFAATNVTDWTEHVHGRPIQEQIGGLWLKKVITAMVPSF